jgi:gas vesicle protein
MREDQGYGAGWGFAAGLLLGGLVGAGVALLMAPESGEDVRRQLTRRARRLADDARDRYSDARRRVRRARLHWREARDAGSSDG